MSTRSTVSSTSDLNHEKTIRTRCNEAIGTISDILVVLNEVSKGHQYIAMGLIIRDSILINKLLIHIEDKKV